MLQSVRIGAARVRVKVKPSEEAVGVMEEMVQRCSTWKWRRYRACQWMVAQRTKEMQTH